MKLIVYRLNTRRSVYILHFPPLGQPFMVHAYKKKTHTQIRKKERKNEAKNVWNSDKIKEARGSRKGMRWGVGETPTESVQKKPKGNTTTWPMANAQNKNNSAVHIKNGAEFNFDSLTFACSFLLRNMQWTKRITFTCNLTFPFLPLIFSSCLLKIITFLLCLLSPKIWQFCGPPFFFQNSSYPINFHSTSNVVRLCNNCSETCTNQLISM